MSQFISPGVFTFERDLSQYVSDLATTITALVGTAEKGPSNSPTLITSAKQFIDTFGQPSPDHYLGYAALAYLKHGNKLYVTRVTAADAAKARLTMPLPASYTPYAGNWTLSSNTTTAATFTVENSTGASGITELVALQTASTLLPGFDFQDTTGVDPINGKLGSDLLSFVLTTDLTDKYVKGRQFKVVTGAGKDSSVVVTNLIANVANPTTALDMTVDARRFNTFNSPLLATATGGLTFKAGVTPADDAALATIGSTSTGGSVKLTFPGTTLAAYDTDGEKDTLITTLDAGGAGALAALNTSLVSVSGTHVIIKVPLYNGTTPGTINAAEAAKNATLLTSILNALLTAFRGTIVALTYPNLAAAAVIAKATANSIVGIGNYDSLTGASEGIKAAEVLTTDLLTVKMSAITVGASGNFTITAAASAILTALPLNITGTFSMDLFRPTWVVSDAGGSKIPTLLKFSSIGEGDFSNMAITVGLNTSNLNSLQEQQYTVELYTRGVSSTILTSSVLQSDFVLTEKYEGSPEVLQSLINSNSPYIALKLDYSTDDTIDPIDETFVYGTTPDYLTASFGLVRDVSGNGVLAGTMNTVSGTSLRPSFASFLAGGSIGTEITKYDLLGTESPKTGIYTFADPEYLDINLLVVPGWSADPSVAKGMVGLCESRGDCMAILDTPFGLSVDNVVSYNKNVLNINSNYAAIYYPWVKITDSYNKKDIFIPPSGLVAGQYAYNDLVGEVYTAPAGRNRGNLTDAIATERVLNQGDRDILALAHINPIHFEAGYGIYIRGQMTLQSATTALDRVNVRRLLLNLRKVIATASKYFEFEPGDAITALRLKQLAESTLEDRLRKGAIRSYKVDVGPKVNTAIVLENNELRMSIEVVATKTAEKIIEVFNILGQGQGISIGA